MKNMRLVFFVSIAMVFLLGQESSGGSMPGVAEGNSFNHADLVWTQSDGLREEIFLSTFAKGKWSAPVQLTDDNAQNLHPAVDTDASGTQWVAWTAIDDGTYSICVMSIKKGMEKSEVQIVSADQPNNIYPTVIVDRSNIPWIIWSATVGTNDDILFSRFIQNKWQKPQLLHQPNNVPDTRPVVDLSDDGQPTVQWQRYMDGEYKNVSSSWLGEKWSKPLPVEQESKESLQADTAAEADERKLVLPETTKAGQNLFIKIYN